MNVTTFLKDLGYGTEAHHSYISNILTWKQWYQGLVDNFHYYSIYNGCKDINLKRYSLNMPKFLCEKMADLLFNEKVDILLKDDKNTEILNEILNKNRFQLLMNRAIEKSFAMGTGCIIASIENILVNGKNGNKTHNFSNAYVKLRYVNAENIYPLSWDDGEIKELAIITYEKISTGQFKCIISLHVLNSVGNYVIKNYQFLTDDKKEIRKEYNVDTYLTEFDTKSKQKWFSIITPNIQNNIDIYSPYGISIFANSIDVIKSIDIDYDSFTNEIKLGRKRLFTTKEVLRFNALTGQNELNFDPNDIVFHVLGDGFSDGETAKNYIQEINGSLRIDDHIKAINANLKTLGFKTGFGMDYFTFDEKSMAPKTATEVINENNDLYRSICKHEILLRYAVEDIVRAISYIGNITSLYSIDTSKITVKFDDSIIENKDKERTNDRQDLSQDTLSRKEYIMKWRNIDEKSAEEKMIEISEEKPEKGYTKFISGEIN